MLAGWVWRGSILDFLLKPFGKVYFFEPAGAFLAAFRVCFWMGLTGAVPAFLWHAYGFLRPALSPVRRLLLKRSLAWMAFLALAGGAFGFLTLKSSLGFLLGFARPGFQPLISGEKALTLDLWICGGFALCFQMPLAAFAMARLGLLKRRFLVRHWRGAVLGIFIATGALAPTTDLASQFLFAAPLCLLYLLSIWIAGYGDSVRPTEVGLRPQA
jgi:sec-independent protein translocase protein TatC